MVAGGGPGGVVLAYLLARAGLPVTLLESRPDFDRRFRGDALAPPVLELLDRLGLARPLLAEIPHGTADAFVWRTPTRAYRLAGGRARPSRTTRWYRRAGSCRSWSSRPRGSPVSGSRWVPGSRHCCGTATARVGSRASSTSMAASGTGCGPTWSSARTAATPRSAPCRRSPPPSWGHRWGATGSTSRCSTRWRRQTGWVGPLLADPVDPAAADAAAAAVEVARRPQVDRDQERQKRTELDAARRLRTRDPRPPLVLRVFASVPRIARWVAARGVRTLAAPAVDERILRAVESRTGP